MNVSGISIDFFKNLFFPAKCCNCGATVDTEGLCNECWSKITWISEPKCQICGLPFTIELDSVCARCISDNPYFDKAVSVFIYNEFSKRIILKFKHSDATYLAEQIAKWMYRSAFLEIQSSDVIVPVPIHFFKRLKRKYNQSELLAKKISEMSGVKYEPRILKKIKQTSSQEELSGKDRRKNVVGSFGVDEKYASLLNGKKVLLVDDVLTTGTTVNECSKVLKKHSVKSVVVVTLARTAYPEN